MSLKSTLVLAACVYILLVLISLHFLPQFDTLFGLEEKPHVHRHRHIRTRDWMRLRCENLTKVTVKTLQTEELDKWFYFLRAYHDTRLDQSHYIRILAIVRHDAVHRKGDINLHCHIPLSPSKYFTTPTTVYEMNENHAMTFGVYMFSCPLPPLLQTAANLCMVRLTNGPEPNTGNNAVEMALESVPHESQSRSNFTVCISPLHGVVETEAFIDFIEINQLLGAQHFVLYKVPTLANLNLEKVLRYYQQEGLITVFNWSVLQKEMHNRLWYYGQVLAIHHCLFHTMGRSKYTIFQDLDELIIPQGKLKNWNEMLKELDDGKASGFRFYSKFFQPNLNYFDADIRTKDFNQVRTKCIVRPELIFEMGIHHVSKQNIESMPPVNVPQEKALVYHYRPCDNFYTDKKRLCQETEKDTRLMLWKEEHTRRKLKVKEHIGLLS